MSVAKLPEITFRFAGWTARIALAALVLPSIGGAGPAIAQDDDAIEEPKHRFGVEAKAHYRDSDAEAFGVSFPFSQDQLPPDATQGFMETVDAGEHAEVSAVSLWYRGRWDDVPGGGLAAKVKVDFIDRHDRNPTSTDEEWDIDELWLRWGPEVEPGQSNDGVSAYLKLGKFPKFERQDDRHLESYGLVSTAFNRMEDIGLEFGADLGEHFYLKASFTEGNPLFLRDPNALAGDNGTPIFVPGAVQNPVSDLKTGVPIPYDADLAIDDVSFDDPETGLGLGLRFGDDTGLWNLDILAFAYRRDLADTREFEGSFYGGDLDLLLGPLNLFPLDVTTRTKEEIGLNVWYYHGGFSLFAQYVDQDLGGMPRDGFEIELAYDIELPWFGTLFGRQLFPYIAPAVRYSELNPEFGGHKDFPAPSFRWPWEKIDIGIRVGIVTGFDITFEYADNTFVRGQKDESLDEFLTTLRLNLDWPKAR